MWEEPLLYMTLQRSTLYAVRFYLWAIFMEVINLLMGFSTAFASFNGGICMRTIPFILSVLSPLFILGSLLYAFRIPWPLRMLYRRLD